MTFDELSSVAQGVVGEVLDSLPGEVRCEVDAAWIFLETEPGRQDIEAGVDPDLLGYFDPGPAEAPAPRIRLWLGNLWDYADGDPVSFREEVEVTLLHEIGHLLGWDEDDVEERGLA